MSLRGKVALYALRFGGWLVAKSTGAHVVLHVEFYEEQPIGSFEGPELTLVRRYEP